MKTTTDPNDPGINKPTKTGQNESYLVLSEEERSKGWLRPYRDIYVHKTCGAPTIMARDIAETYARDPGFYGRTFCVRCGAHLPVSEFFWEGTEEEVGS
jgi:hypothetical protein